jgi:hypothetical protein
MMRGINYFDAVNWLNAAKKTAPGPVYNSLLSLAETELPPYHLEKLYDGILV